MLPIDGVSNNRKELIHHMKPRRIDWRWLTTNVFFAFLGIIALPILENRTEELISQENVEIAIFFTFCFFAVLSSAFWKANHNTSENIVEKLDKILGVIGQDARLVPYPVAYTV